MRVFVTGGTGFIGRKVALRLARDGHHVLAWVRDPARARAIMGVEPTLLSTEVDDAALADALTTCDAVINLAGAPVAQRWTARVRTQLEVSRVDLTDRLVRAMASRRERPAVLVSASAVGVYGERGDEPVTEASPGGAGFLAALSQRWEAAALAAEPLGVRVALMRIGLVLGRDGGALPKMAPAFRFGLGATLGSGRQMMPWIHVHDAVALIMAALENPAYRGPINVTAPTPISNRAFTAAVAAAVGRPVLLRVPAFALRLAMGEAAQIVLGGADVRPAAAQRLGFRFAFPELAPAVTDLLRRDPRIEIGPAPTPPDADYLRRRPPRYRLRAQMRVQAPTPEVFQFFRRAENLGAMTPPEMSFRILTSTPVAMGRGTTIRYRIRLGPLPLPWVTEIGVWDPPHAFSDAQQRGPYASWYHHHAFFADGGATKAVDEVWYAPPLGPLGAIANRLFIAPALRRIFSHRAEAMHWRFGTATDDATVSHAC